MGNSRNRPIGALLVGSVPLSGAEKVFRVVCSILGDRIRRVPDGETGERWNWIAWQFPIFANHPLFDTLPTPQSDVYTKGATPSSDPFSVVISGVTQAPRVKLRSGVLPSDLAFGRLGYADAARESYVLFRRLKREGVIPQSCRFQVSLPTPLASINAYVSLEDQEVVERPYEAMLLAELDEICSSIAHSELAVQWDVAEEMAILEGVFPTYFSDTMTGIVERLSKIGKRVPVGVELGYHFCYGDAGHTPFWDPIDASALVEVASSVSESVSRPISWIHMPVPRQRIDKDYFAPLTELELRTGTELYLGLVHYTDGVSGTLKRIEAAQTAVREFGVSTACGLGRRPHETIPELLRIHAEVAQTILPVA